MKNVLVKTAIEKLLVLFAKQDFPAEIGWQIIRRRRGDRQIPSDAWSPGNRWIMLAGGTADARGFGQWNQAGRRVKPGSKALYICTPSTRKITSDEDDDLEAAKTIVAGFRWIPVFRVEDTVGKPLPELANLAPEVLPPLFDVAQKLGVSSIEYVPFNGRTLGSYQPSNREIRLSETSALTFFHELMHHLDSQIEPIRPGRLAEAELIAELGASVLCSLQGITGFEAISYRYLKLYAEGKQPEAVLRSIMSVAARVETLVGIVLDAAEEGQISPALHLQEPIPATA